MSDTKQEWIEKTLDPAQQRAKPRRDPFETDAAYRDDQAPM